MNIGYARTSTTEQKAGLHAQIRDLVASLQVDQVIDAIGKPDLALPFVGPRRGRIAQRDE
jgi:predicted site-specific integrase-resolvase